jgi:DNA primase
MSDPVLSLLNSNNIAFKVSGKDYVIHCLNPEHEDNDPSCRVDKITGLTHCFSCGWKRNLFKHFGVFTDTSSIKVAKLKEKLKELREQTIELDFPEGYSPYTTTFRGISSKTLKKFEAFHTNTPEKLVDRVVFPIRDATGKIVVFLGRHILSDAKPKYTIYPSGKPLPIFPCVMENTKSIVLVEGIVDMLNLYDKGLTNACCTFGTSTITEKTVDMKMLQYKAQGINKVHLMYDGDEAGRTAAKSLKPVLENAGFLVNIIDLPDDTDPGNLSLEDVESIKEYINENSDN